MARKPAKLLIVDDNPVVLIGVSELFRSAGFEVVEASNGAEGLQRAKEHEPDLVLLDVVLPDLNGIEVCRQLKLDPSSRPFFVVLLSSIETSSGSQAWGLDAGADGYIARPIENRELLARVQALLRIQQAEAALREAQEALERRVEERTAELAKANAGLRAMSLRLVQLQESERRFLARELHDEVGQLLTGLKMAMEQSLMLANKPVRERLKDAANWIDALIARVRRMSLDLRPQILDDFGLLVALEWHFKRYAEQTNIQVDFRHRGVPERLPALLETAIFRIVQEALTNAARHAGVDRIKVRCWADGDRAGVKVEDRGAGFDVAAALAAHASVGLCGMKERTELLGGNFTLESAPGKGTRLAVELPLANGDGPSRRPGGDAP